MIAVRAVNTDAQAAEFATIVEKHGGTVLSVAADPKSRWHVFFRVENERMLTSVNAKWDTPGQA